MQFRAIKSCKETSPGNNTAKLLVSSMVKPLSCSGQNEATKKYWGSEWSWQRSILSKTLSALILGTSGPSFLLSEKAAGGGGQPLSARLPPTFISLRFCFLMTQAHTVHSGVRNSNSTEIYRVKCELPRGLPFSPASLQRGRCHQSSGRLGGSLKGICFHVRGRCRKRQVCWGAVVCFSF